MKLKVLSILLIFTLTISPIQAQNSSNFNLKDLGFKYNYTINIDEIGSFVDITTTGDDVVLTGYFNLDRGVSSGGSGPGHTSVYCYGDETHYLIGGNDVNTKYKCGGDGFAGRIAPNGTFEWGTFIGGDERDFPEAVTIDHDGNVIIVGHTKSKDMIGEQSYDQELDFWGDAFIAKMTPNGKLLWSSIIGGDSSETANNVVVDSNNNLIVVGVTRSDNFPVLNGFDDHFENSGIWTTDAFLAKFDTNGSLIWSSYFGGSDIDNDFTATIDAQDNLVIAGVTRSTDFPILNAVRSEHSGLIDTFLAKVSPEGELILSTFIGGDNLDTMKDVKIDSQGDIVMVGYSNSLNFPITAPDDGKINDDGKSGIYGDAVIVKVQPNGEFLWSTYLGGSGADDAAGLEIDPNDHIIVVGTTSSNDFPVIGADNIRKLNADTDYETGDLPSDIFISIFNSEGQLGYSFFYGGTSDEYVYSTARGTDDTIFFIGRTLSGAEDLGGSFPVLNSPDNVIPGNYFISSVKLPSEIEPRAKSGIDQTDGSQGNDNDNQNDGQILPFFDNTSLLILGIFVAIPAYPFFRNVLPKVYNKTLKQLRRNPELDNKKDQLRDYYRRLNE